MSHLSKVTRTAAAATGTYEWRCEFCGAVNADLALAAEETPEGMAAALAASGGDASKGVDYMMAPPTVPPAAAPSDTATGGAGTAAATAAPAEDTSVLVFVCDTSGSMCVSEPLSDGVARKLRGSRTTEAQALRAAGDDANQFLPHERRGVTYVTRMQALQAAVAQQVESIAKAKPTRRVGLVSFATDVVIHGDGTTDSRTLAGTRLTDFETLKAAGDGAGGGGGEGSALLWNLPHSYISGAGEGFHITSGVAAASEGLLKRLYDLSEEGQTALGPAGAWLGQLCRLHMAHDSTRLPLYRCSAGGCGTGVAEPR